MSQGDSWINSPVGQRRGAALGAELAEARLHLAGDAPVLVAVLVPARAVVDRQPGEGRRQLGVLELERVAGDDPHPGPAAGGHRREGADVVLDDHVGLELVEDLDEPLVDVARAVEQRLPGRGDELPELLEGRLAEDGRRLADEVLPELARAPPRPRAAARAASAAPRSPSPRASRRTTPRSTKTTRWPRRRSTSPMPTQLLVGPNAPSGKKTIVFPRASSHPRESMSEQWTHLSIWATAVRR